MKKLPLLLLVALLSFSCSNDDDNNPVIQPQEFNIVETAQSTPILSSLVAAVIEADLDVTLSGDGPFTVLAPTNDAFAAFLSDNGWTSVADIPNDALVQTLLNHVISGEVLSTDLTSAGSGYASTNATTPGGANVSLYYDTSNGVRFNGVASVVEGFADVGASNGIVHIVDAVIGVPTIVDHALANPNFSTLVTALTDLTPATDFVTVLQGDGPFTVLAPTNDAFDALDAIPEEGALTQILLNHVIEAPILSSDLDGMSGYTNTLAETSEENNISIYFDGTDGVSFNGMSNVAIPDVVASNGIIHAVDAVITLPTIATFATSNPALSTLVDALAYADTGTPTVPYINTVSNSEAGPYTVFAPTNDAFADLLVELEISALTDLDTDTVDNVLLYHIVDANVQSSGLPNGTVMTLGGDITADNMAFTLTDANNRVSNIVTTLVDIQGVNGVVHVIDKVILFPL